MKKLKLGIFLNCLPVLLPSNPRITDILSFTIAMPSSFFSVGKKLRYIFAVLRSGDTRALVTVIINP